MDTITSSRRAIESFQDFEQARAVRNKASYKETDVFIKQELERYLLMYQQVSGQNQTSRLIRDQIDNLLRRYHGYMINGSIGGHYREVGLTSKKGTVLEHVIPAKTVRNLLIKQVITIDQALNSPLCVISTKSDSVLRKNKFVKHTPNIWFFWQRYSILSINIETHDGVAVDQSQWDLSHHWNYFNIGLQNERV